MKKSLFIFCLFSFVFFYHLSLQACSCMPLDTGDLTKQSDYIFIGKIIKKASQAFEAEFQVVASWKGDVSRKVRVSTEDTTCGIEFKKNSTYVIFGVSDNKGGVSTNRCRGTGEINTWIEQHLNALSREDELKLRLKLY